MAVDLITYSIKAQDDLSPALEDVATAADKADGALEGTTKATTDYTAAAGKLSAGLLAVGAAVGAILQDLADYKNLMNDSAVETRLSATTLQGLSLALDGGGDSLDAILPGLKQLPKIMNEAAKGTGPAAEAFKTLGVEVANADGTLRSADEVFKEAIGALNGIENEAQRSALGMTIFTEASGKLLKNLGNTETLDAFTAKAAILGPNLEAGSAGAASFQRSMADLNLVLKGTLDQFAQLFGGEGGGAALIDDFVTGLVFAREIVAVNVENMISVFKALVLAATSVPRAIKAALTGEDISDALMAPFDALAKVDLMPVDNAIAKVKELIAARKALASAGAAGAGGGAGVDTGTGTGSGGAAVAAVAEVEGASMAFARKVERLGTLLARLGSSGLDLTDSQAATGASLKELQAMLRSVSAEDLPYLSEVIGQFADAAKEKAAEIEDPAPVAEAAGGAGLGIATDILGVVAGGFGGLTSLLSSFGPVGTIIGAILSILSVGAEGIFATIDGLTDSVMTVLEAIPDLLVGLMPVLGDLLERLLSELPNIIGEIVEALPELVTSLTLMLVTVLIPQLLLLIPRLVVALLTAVPAILASFWTEFPSAMMEALKDLPTILGDAFGDMFGSLADAVQTIPATLTTIFLDMPGLLADGLRAAFEELLTQFGEVIADAMSFKGITGRANRESADVLRSAAGREGAGSQIIFQGGWFGDDRSVLKRIRDLLGNGRTGVSFG